MEQCRGGGRLSAGDCIAYPTLWRDGGGALWLAANVFIFTVLVVRAHRDGIAGYAWGWAWNCVIPQFAVTGAVYAVALAALPQASSPLLVVAAAVIAAGLAFLVSIAVSSELRHSVISFVRRSFFPCRHQPVHGKRARDTGIGKILRAQDPIGHLGP